MRDSEPSGFGGLGSLSPHLCGGFRTLGLKVSVQFERKLWRLVGLSRRHALCLFLHRLSCSFFLFFFSVALGFFWGLPPPPARPEAWLILGGPLA